MNEHKHLITAADYKVLARPASVHLDDDEVQAYITECEDMHIIPAIGYANFNRAVNSLTCLMKHSPHPFGLTGASSLPVSAGVTGGRCGVLACEKRSPTMCTPKCFAPTGQWSPVLGRCATTTSMPVTLTPIASNTMT